MVDCGKANKSHINRFNKLYEMIKSNQIDESFLLDLENKTTSSQA